jgi:NAD(P)-dependent dehydrogenase (short-subunit alcohol dehydrogenase family)
MSGAIIIFGATGGIGADMAQRLKGAAPLHLVGRDAARLSALAGSLEASHAVCDVTMPDQIDAAIAAAVDAHEDIAGLVYAVGTINLKPVGKLTDADFERDFTVNALGAARAARAASPHLLAQARRQGVGSSAMLFFSTVAVGQGFAAHASIAMAKGAVEGLTRSLAAELSPHVRVNAIAPSLTETNIAKPLLSSEQMAKAIAQMHPIPRIGQPSDAGALGAFLMGPDASWVTGQVMLVDGGRGALRAKG